MFRISIYNLVALIFLIQLASFDLMGQNSADKKRQVREYLKQKYEKEFGENSISLNNVYAAARNKSELKVTEFTDIEIREVEPTIAVNPTNPDNIVVSFIHKGLDSGQSIYYTHDAGESWTRTIFRMDSLFHLDFNNLEIEFDRGAADPVLAFDSSGKLYYVWLYAGNNVANNFLITANWAWSEDGGQSFQVADEKFDRVLAIKNSAINSEGAFFDRPWLAIDKSNGDNHGTIYLQFYASIDDNHIIDLPLNSAIVLYKTPDMTTFDSYQVPLDDIIPVTDGISQLQLANIYVDHKGILHSSMVGLPAGGIGSDKIYHFTSSDGSQSFSNTSSITDAEFDTNTIGVSSNQMPDAITNPLTGNTHMVFGKRNEEGYSGAFISSYDKAINWTEEIDIVTMLGSSSTEIFYPSIAVDEISGRISIAYMGRDSETAWNYYVSSSIDDGNSWSTPCVISTLSSNFQSFFEQQDFFGDYWETKLLGDKTYCVWNDYREGLGLKMYVAIVDHLEVVNIVESSPITDEIKIVKIFPNPSSKEINIKFEAKNRNEIKMEILTFDGKSILSINNNIIVNGEQIITLNLPYDIIEGNYILKINTAYGQFIRKLYVSN